MGYTLIPQCLIVIRFQNDNYTGKMYPEAPIVLGLRESRIRLVTLKESFFINSHCLKFLVNCSLQ